MRIRADSAAVDALSALDLPYVWLTRRRALIGHLLDTTFEIIGQALDFPGAPYGTERTATETSIKRAFPRLSAERVIPPGCTTGNL